MEIPPCLHCTWTTGWEGHISVGIFRHSDEFVNTPCRTLCSWVFAKQSLLKEHGAAEGKSSWHRGTLSDSKLNSGEQEVWLCVCWMLLGTFRFVERGTG